MVKTQTLAFPVRVPDAMQARARRVLHASREAINDIVTLLWPDLDTFAGERTSQAWKQVEQHLIQRSGHGNRQERCEMESAGRILRAQATRKQIFQTILPILIDGLIKPAEDKRPARKEYRAIQAAVRALRDDTQETESFLAMTNVVEQACNVFLKTGAFPTTYEQMQPIPVQQVAQLTYAGDDGMTAGQAYHIRQVYRGERCDLTTREELPEEWIWHVQLRGPDEQGVWGWWPEEHPVELPEAVRRYRRAGATTQAPTLREVDGDDGSHFVVLDVVLEVPAQLVPPLEREKRALGFDWGVRSLITVSILQRTTGEESYRQISRPVFLDCGGLDGRQARLRREIDRLVAKRDTYRTLVTSAKTALSEQKIPLPSHFPHWQVKAEDLERRRKACWKAYGRRNQELAHLASNLLILLALLYDCRLICGEDLRTLTTRGRGRDVRGRFRHWRNTTTVRGELWRVVKYKCYLLGIRTRREYPDDTSHTCPHCRQPAQTYRSPSVTDRKKAVDSGAWLWCEECGWNGSRDYAASLNIARLGLAFLVTYQRTQRYRSYRMTSLEVNPCSYTRRGATLLLPSQGVKARPLQGTKIYYAGWSYSIALRTSQPRSVLALLSTAAVRKRVYDSA
ncbi:MAG: transposase [Chloroflexi bacterium]|nr:MAG: transposase [Chloroflexota bacterium]